MSAIEINQTQMNDVLSLLSGIEKDAKKALFRSLNRTATGAKTLTAKGIGSTVTMKSAKIKEYISIKKANSNNLISKIIMRGALAPAIQFTNRQLARGVSVKIYKSKTPDKFRHAFYATMPNGSTGIYIRKEISPGVYAPRLPIKQILGPPITTVYEKTPGLANDVEQTSAERLLKEMDAQVNFILSKQ